MAISKRSRATPKPERRRGKRFPLREQIQYQLSGLRSHTRGTGVTLNVSSHGILFTTESKLPVGRRVEFTLNWPVEIDCRCALQFVGIGVVVRSSVNQAAVKIVHHEFRTRGNVGLSGAGP